jgi:hypothetical protein
MEARDSELNPCTSCSTTPPRDVSGNIPICHTPALIFLKSSFIRLLLSHLSMSGVSLETLKLLSSRWNNRPGTVKDGQGFCFINCDDGPLGEQPDIASLFFCYSVLDMNKVPEPILTLFFKSELRCPTVITY